VRRQYFPGRPGRYAQSSRPVQAHCGRCSPWCSKHQGDGAWCLLSLSERVAGLVIEAIEPLGFHEVHAFTVESPEQFDDVTAV